MIEFWVTQAHKNHHEKDLFILKMLKQGLVSGPASFAGIEFSSSMWLPKIWVPPMSKDCHYLDFLSDKKLIVCLFISLLLILTSFWRNFWKDELNIFNYADLILQTQIFF
jgi:hypothetical protein